MIYRRQRKQYVFAGLLAAIAVINVLFFFILNRPAQTEYQYLQDEISRLGAQVTNQQQYLIKLELTSTQLERFDQDRAELLKHFLPRQTGYSEILNQVDEIARRTGVQTTRVNLPIENAQFGLFALGITIPVEGSYSNVVNFVRELENSDIFFLINAIDVQSASDATQPGAAGKITLALMLETYFYQ